MCRQLRESELRPSRAGGLQANQELLSILSLYSVARNAEDLLLKKFISSPEYSSKSHHVVLASSHAVFANTFLESTCPTDPKY